MKKFVLIVTFLASGCASAIMEGFVGKDISEVVLQYGPPVNKIDMPDGRIAFQWSMDSYVVMPSTTNIYSSGNIATVNSYGGGVFTNTCLYTLFATPSSNNSYTITGFQKPRLDCE